MAHWMTESQWAEKLSQLWGKPLDSMTLGDYVMIAGLVALTLVVLFLLVATLFDW